MEALHPRPRLRGLQLLCSATNPTLHPFRPYQNRIAFSSLHRKPYLSRRLQPLRLRQLAFVAAYAHGRHPNGDGHHHHHDHDHDHDHHSHNHHHHQHHHPGHGGELKASREAVLRFAKVTGWLRLANYLREHLQLCCCSAAALLAAAVCPYLVPKQAAKLLQNAFLIVAFPLVGVSASLDAILELSGGKVNIHVLMALAAFASVLMGNPLEGCLLLVMFNMAHIAEEYFTSRSMLDVKELKENYPDFATVLEAENELPRHLSDIASKRIPVHDLKVGSFLLVRAGEFVPVDGEVVQGSSTVTTEHLTGEVKPLSKKVGDEIPGGARSQEGMMVVKVLKTWKESTLNKIVELTEEARLSKPKLQRWLDEFGERYSKVVMLLSLAIAVGGPFLFKWPFMSMAGCRGSIYRALGFMMAASPCALAVAPLTYATAISACAKKGILLKGGHVLDALASCHTAAFDKTGTLTTGILKIKAIEPIVGHEVKSGNSEFVSCCIPSCEKEALAVAAAMEQGSTHPIGRAVIDHAAGKDIPSVVVENFASFPGKGLSVTLKRGMTGITGSSMMKASLGSIEFITSLCNSEDESIKIMEAAKTSSYGSDFVQAALSVNKKVTLLHFEDEPREGVLDVIASLLRKARLRLIMLTGDHYASAWRIAKAVGIKEVHCSLKPEDKLNYVKSISNGGGLAMVGDGINDAPALAAATVGIVLARHASATAIAAADVLLLQDNISGVPFCIAKSRQTISLVKQNVALALCSIVLAALPSVLGFLPLWLTVLLHEGGTLLVCLNSVRALRDPTWSWKQDVQQVIGDLRSFIHNLSSMAISSTTRAAPL